MVVRSKKKWSVSYKMLLLGLFVAISFLYVLNDTSYTSTPVTGLYKKQAGELIKKNPDSIKNLSMFSTSDIELLLKYGPDLVKKQDQLINSILDERFRQRCSGKDRISFKYDEECNYEFFYHFMNSKIKLGRIEELTKNKEITKLVKNTYDYQKNFYSNIEYLDPYYNKWSKMINMVGWVNLLDDTEKNFWILKYSTVKLDENKPLFSQTWNRIWAFYGLGITKADDLRLVEGIDYEVVKNNICSYTPFLEDFEKEDVFKEGKPWMMIKYLNMMKFCDKKVYLINPLGYPYIRLLYCNQFSCHGFFKKDFF